MIDLSNLTVNGSLPVGPSLTVDTILALCPAVQNADAQIFNATVTAFVLMVVSSLWYGVVRGNGGLRQRLLDRWGGVRFVTGTVHLFDGLLLPGAAFATALALAQMVMLR